MMDGHGQTGQQSTQDPTNAGSAGEVAAGPPLPPSGVEWRFFIIGCVLLAIAVGFGVWAFGLGCTTTSQRQILQWALPLASAFAAGSFTGSLTVNTRGILPGLIATATGGFAIWFMTGQLLSPSAGGCEVPAVPTLASLEMFTRANLDDHTVTVFDVRSSENPVFDIKPYDDFRLLGKLTTKASWALAWLDTQGQATIIPSSGGTDVAYPSVDQFVAPDIANPLGTHALLIIDLAAATPDDVGKELSGLVPPQLAPWKFPRGPRGPGVSSPSEATKAGTFLLQVAGKLTHGERVLRAVFITTSA